MRRCFAAYPDKQFFALFDFDDAYEDWRSLGGSHQVTEIDRRLCKKLDGKHAYAFLLPIPDNALKTQVWDEANSNEKIRPNARFSIEHIFWGVDGLNNWFRTDKGSGRVSFKGDKVRFAKKIVPNLDAACFESFRPMFDFIKSRIDDAIVGQSNGTEPAIA